MLVGVEEVGAAVSPPLGFVLCWGRGELLVAVRLGAMGLFVAGSFPMVYRRFRVLQVLPTLAWSSAVTCFDAMLCHNPIPRRIASVLSYVFAWWWSSRQFWEVLLCAHSLL